MDKWEVKLGLMIFFTGLTIGTASAGWWGLCDFYCIILICYLVYAIPDWSKVNFD